MLHFPLVHLQAPCNLDWWTQFPILTSVTVTFFNWVMLSTRTVLITYNLGRQGRLIGVPKPDLPQSVRSRIHHYNRPLSQTAPCHIQQEAGLGIRAFAISIFPLWLLTIFKNEGLLAIRSCQTLKKCDSERIDLRTVSESISSLV